MSCTLVDTSELEGQVPATDTLKSCRGNKMSLWKREKCKTLSTNAEQGEGCLDGDEASASVRVQMHFDRWLSGCRFWWCHINKLSKKKIQLP